VTFAIPPRPAVFSPDVPPPGVELDLVSFWDERPLLPVAPRLQLAHTQAGKRTASNAGLKRYIEGDPDHQRTLPNYALELGGAAVMFLPLNRRGIANSTVKEYELPETHPAFPFKGVPAEQRPKGASGDISWWSNSIETADTGTIDDPSISAFTDAQLETLAVIFAYGHCCFPDVMPLTYPVEWWGGGTATHTEPYGYPYTTLYQGKTCPGAKKKAQMTEVLLGARAIVRAWFPPPPPEEDEVTPADIEAIADRVIAKLVETKYNVADPNDPDKLTKANLFSVTGWTWNRLRKGS
jgi:hypothetical protein